MLLLSGTPHIAYRIGDLLARWTTAIIRALLKYTDKNENQIFLMFKEIQIGSVAKLYMRKGFLIYEEMRKYFHIYEEAVSHIWLCNGSILNFLIYEENLIFFFISVPQFLFVRNADIKYDLH